MLIIVQQSVRGFCLVMMDYIASSVEKMDILLVGVQKDDNQPQDQSLNTFTSSQTCNCQDTKVRKACFYCSKERHFISQCHKKLLDQKKKKRFEE
jgi:hypothetical protein